MENNWQLDPTHSGSFLRLKKILPRLQGFRLFLFQFNQAQYRDGIISTLNEDTDKLRTTLIDVKTLDSYAALEQRLFSLPKTWNVVHLINLDLLSPSEQNETFKSLNYHREQLADACHCTLIIWLSASLIKKIALQAADFWAWREQVIDFSITLAALSRWEPDNSTVWGLDKDKKQQRIAEIENELRQSDPEPSLSRGDQHHELGNLQTMLGDYTQAQKSFSQAMEIFWALDETHAYARVMSDLTELKIAQGNPNAALTELETKVLPWFIKLNDKKYQAETKGKIADILQARGNLDEALRIRKEDQLPVYESLGEVRSIAITKGQIADILFLNDQHSQAFELRESEVLPVLETLEDKHGLLINQANLAIQYLQTRHKTERAAELLLTAYQSALDMQLPEAEQIKSILKQLSGDQQSLPS